MGRFKIAAQYIISYTTLVIKTAHLEVQPASAKLRKRPQFEREPTRLKSPPELEMHQRKNIAADHGLFERLLTEMQKIRTQK